MPMPSAETNLEATTMRHVSWRLKPFLLLAYLICYIVRVNAGFASLQMNKAVGIDTKTYGLGVGIFFVGYFFLEVPSNLALERFGARTWIARIMISWGIVSAAFALIGGPISFLVLRFLLGAAEAGFFPGVILYITYLVPGAFPRDHRRRLHGGDPGRRPDRLADLGWDPLHGLLPRSRRLAVDLPARGLPAVLLGIASCVWLTDRPEHASCLEPRQQQWLIAKLETERRRAPRIAHDSVWSAMTNKCVLIMALVYAGAARPPPRSGGCRNW